MRRVAFLNQLVGCAVISLYRRPSFRTVRSWDACVTDFTQCRADQSARRVGRDPLGECWLELARQWARGGWMEGGSLEQHGKRFGLIPPTICSVGSIGAHAGWR